MTESLQPRIGSGRCQWNFGAWLGSTLGSTVWMLLAAGSFVFHQEFAVALIPLGFFLLINGIAWWLWSTRDRVEPFSAFMIFLAMLGIAIPTIMLSMERWGSPIALEQMNYPGQSPPKLMAFLMVPVMMMWFYLMERSSKSARKPNSNQTIDSV